MEWGEIGLTRDPRKNWEMVRLVFKMFVKNVIESNTNVHQKLS